MMTEALVVGLGLLAVTWLARYYGRQEGREEANERHASVLSEVLREDRRRDAKYRELLAEVDRLKTMAVTGRRAGRS